MTGLARLFAMNEDEIVPVSDQHGVTPDDIASKLKPLNPQNWRQSGNRLIADTEIGEVVNIIPTDYILTGVKDGKPVLTKISV